MTQGSYLGIVGPNGCGKTTLLKAILGILPLLGGNLDWADGRRPRIGYVPQRDAIDPIYPYRALEVVLLGLGTEHVFRPSPTREMRERAERALERVGLANHRYKGYSELSGGQRQRVLVARAIAVEPQLFALDEPTSGLDPGSTERLLDVVDEMRELHHLTVILVSHDLSLVARRATHALAMFEGKYVVGPVETTITTEQLSHLYQYPLRVVRSNGDVSVGPHRERKSVSGS
ncbi:MAG: metal ABC transporter ATP-binding protein [Planctomycetes bacterium]|nr:metal ABC transporter ATP-binding protein [Planctomycetota bacterium]